MKFTKINPFPSHKHEILLKAALCPSDLAVKSWNDWNKLVDFEGFFDEGSFRLMPLVYKNLVRCEPKQRFIDKLKNVYLQNWYKNQQLFFEGSEIISFLEKNGIKTIVLKGPALSYFGYRDMGVRPMADIDLMVPFKKASETISLLKSDGWIPEFAEYIDYNLKFGRSMMFRREDEFELDLHWHPLFEAQEQNSESDFWDKAIPFSISGVESLSLCPEDMLLEVIVHGLRYNPVPPIRWVPDSLKLIENCSNEINWDYFLAQTKKYRVALHIRLCFEYLQKTFDTRIPLEVIENLRQIKIRYAEKQVFKDGLSEEIVIDQTLKQKLRKLFLIYLRQTKETNFFFQIIGFWRFLKFRTRGKNPLKIIWFYLTKKTAG